MIIIIQIIITKDNFLNLNDIGKSYIIRYEYNTYSDYFININI